MKKHLILIGILAIAVIFVMAGTATAVDKLGFINMRTILQESEAGKKGFAELKKLYEKKKAEITKKEEELKKTKDELDKQKSVLTAQAFQEKEMNFQVRVREYQRFAKDAQDEMAAKEQAINGKMIPEILKVVEKVGKDGKYDAIIDLNNPVVVYHDREDNLTKKIIEEYNKGGGKSSSAPAKNKK